MASNYAQVEKLREDYKNSPQNGLKICETRLKRNPGNLAFTLAFARFLQDSNRDGEVIATLENIKTPGPNVDPEILSGIQETIAHSRRAIAGQHLLKSEGGSFLLNLWTRAMERANKQQKQIYRQHMFKAAVRDGYWDLAQQVFAWLQKEYPSNAKYHFIWILFTHLRAKACQIERPDDPTAGRLFETLAFRSLDTAVANTLHKKDTSKKILSIKELRLLILVYEDQERYDELLKVLDNPMIGIDSDLAKEDTSLKQRRLELLEMTCQRKATYDLCYSSLNALLDAMGDPTSEVPSDLVWVDDLDTWTFLIDAACEGQTFGFWSANFAVEGLIERYLEIQPCSRNASVAALYYANKVGKSRLSTECSRFFSKQCARPSCFDDLRKYLEDLDSEAQEKFLETAREWLREGGADSLQPFDDWVMSEINLLKLTYLLSFSKASGPSHFDTEDIGQKETNGSEQNDDYSPKTDDIINFTRDCLRLFEFGRDHKIPTGNEAALLAALALFRMIPSGPVGVLRRDGTVATGAECLNLDVVKSSLVQAVAILEYLNGEESFNYSVQLLLLRAYLLLGLGSLAMAALHKLRLKEVQNETAKHLFYTRISTIHPFPAGDKQSAGLPEHIRDPLLGCMDVQPWYSRASRQLVDSISGDLDEIPLDKVAEYVEFKDRLDRSVARVMYQIEQRRMARLRDQTLLLGPPLSYTLEKELVDDRDFDVFPDFEHSLNPSFAELSSAGPPPNTLWIAAANRADLLQTLLQSKAMPSASQINNLNSIESAMAEELKTKQPGEELTAVEGRFLLREWGYASNWMLELLAPPNAPLIWAPEIHLDRFNKMRNSLKDPVYFSLLEKGPPMWTTLHVLFSDLERLKTWERLCDMWASIKKKEGKNGRLPKEPSVDQIQVLKKEVKGRAVAMQNKVRAWKVKLEQTGTEQILEMMKSESNLEQLLGTERLKRYARSMRDSAVDALDGVIKVKVG